VNVLKRKNGAYEQTCTFKAHDKQILHLALSNDASTLASVCCAGKFKLWDVKLGMNKYMFSLCFFALIHTGTLMQEMPFEKGRCAIFFNHSSNKLIVACKEDIFLVDVRTKSVLSFGNTPPEASYEPYALALSGDDAVLAVGAAHSVRGLATLSHTQLWIHNTAGRVGAVCMLGAHVLVTLYYSSTLLLDINTGIEVSVSQKPDKNIFALGVIEG
jgi:WD40 repeat protein